MVCLGFEPLGGKMESTDESTEHPCIALVLSCKQTKLEPLCASLVLTITT